RPHLDGRVSVSRPGGAAWSHRPAAPLPSGRPRPSGTRARRARLARRGSLRGLPALPDPRRRGPSRWGGSKEERMERVFRRRPFVAALLVAVAAAQPVISRGQTSQPDQLRRELDAMKEQLRRVQEQMKKQEAIIQKQQAVIDKLSGAQPAVAAPAAPPAAPPAETAEEEHLKRQVTEQVLRRIQPSLTAANKTFPSQFNPAIGLILDNVAFYGTKARGDFQFRAAELGVSASVDPFARGYAIITGSPDGFDVEEAAIVTTSLPYNLTLKGGRFFADFGRLSKFHDHDLPFVNRPIALDRFVGGEAQSDGVELNYLLPTSQYVTLTAGAYNKMGAVR